MADQSKIREILRRRVRPGKAVTELQLSQIARKIVETRTADAGQIRKFTATATNDSNSIVLLAVDMGGIKNELEKDPPRRSAYGSG